MAQQIKKRSDAIDMVKGLSIITLFFLHFENGCFNFNYNFFLVRSPAFYIIVGWLWGLSQNRRSVTEHWNKRLQGLVKPYIYFSLIFLTFDLIMMICQLQEPLILYRDIYKTLCLRGIGTLWFLPALLGGEIILLYLRTKKLHIKIAVAAFILILLYIIWNGVVLKNDTYNDIINAPIRAIKDICSSFIYISITYFISRRFGKIIISRSKKQLFLFGIILLCIDFYIMNFANMEVLWREVALFITGNLLAGIGIILIFTAIENLKAISKPLAYCGKNSLIIMAIHWLLFLATLIIDKELFKYETYYGQRTIIYFIIAFILQVIIIEFINKKIPFIIGK